MNRVGPYELGPVLGVGSLGTVYRSSGPTGPVAVKIIHPELADRPGFRARLLREAELAERVTGPGIVRVVGVDASGAQPYLVTELLDAPTLQDEVSARGPLSGARLERFANTLIQALGTIHRAHVMHRDLKPTNVLVGWDGTAHVVDFGLAALLEQRPSKDEGRGTIGWMAPEVASGQEPTLAADVYGWGLVVAYAALGRSPLASGGPPDLSTIPGHLLPAVAAALDPDPARRSAAYVPASFPSPVPRSVPVPPTELPSRPRRHWPELGVAAAAMILSGIGLALALRDSSPLRSNGSPAPLAGSSSVLGPSVPRTSLAAPPSVATILSIPTSGPATTSGFIRPTVVGPSGAEQSTVVSTVESRVTTAPVVVPATTGDPLPVTTAPPLATTVTVVAVPPLVLYDDVFRNGVTLNQFNGRNDVASNAVVHSGKLAISSTLEAPPSEPGFQSVFYITLPERLKTAPYTELHFWVRATGPKPVAININAIVGDGSKAIGESRSAVATSTEWTEVVVLLDALITDRNLFDGPVTRYFSLAPANTVGLAATGNLLYDDITLTAG